MKHLQFDPNYYLNNNVPFDAFGCLLDTLEHLVGLNDLLKEGAGILLKRVDLQQDDE